MSSSTSHPHTTPPPHKSEIMNKELGISKMKSIIHNSKFLILFSIILLIGIYLRFYRIEEVIAFGLDQGRDAWVVRDILQGKFTLIGPRTGIGHFHLGPAYYYLMAPFFYISNLDPMGANYFNITANIFNFVVIFIVSKKIFNNYAALFIILLFATSHYLMESRIPWNVTLLPGISALLFFSITKIYQKKYKWIFVAWTLCGFAFHLHFTAIFFPIILTASMLFVQDKIKVLKYFLLSIPLYLLWFIPNIVYELQSGNSDYYRMREFLQYYYHGFHFRFLIHRISDSLIIFSSILNYPPFIFMKFVIPLLFLCAAFIFGKKKDRLFGYLISLWFLIPLVGFTLYGGPISDYYFISGVPMVLFVIWYLQERILRLNFKPILILLIIFWVLYIYHNTQFEWVKPTYGGLREQKDLTRNIVRNGGTIEFGEGEIKSYLYRIWVQDGKRF